MRRSLVASITFHRPSSAQSPYCVAFSSLQCHPWWWWCWWFDDWRFIGHQIMGLCHLCFNAPVDTTLDFKLHTLSLSTHISMQSNALPDCVCAFLFVPYIHPPDYYLEIRKLGRFKLNWIVEEWMAPHPIVCSTQLSEVELTKGTAIFPCNISS